MDNQKEEEFEEPTEVETKAVKVYEAEEWVIACMFDDDSCLYRAMDYLTRDDFSDSTHRKIFDTCKALRTENIPIDLSTIASRLDPSERRVSHYIKDQYPTTETFEYWLRYVKRFSLEEKLREETKNPDVDLEKIDSIVNAIMHVNETVPLYLPISEVPDLQDDPTTLIKTGLPDVDYWLRFRLGNVLVVGGWKGEGKTSFGLGALHYMSQKYPVGVISLEMTAQEVKLRIRQAFGGLVPTKNFLIADPSSLSISGFHHICKRFKEREGVQLVMLDYLQLMMETSKFQSRHLEISYVIRRIKEIAKELDIGIIVISSLSRGIVEHSRPSSSHLKESGDIEYAADSIIFIWSPEEGDKEFVSEDVRVIIVDKNRFGMSKVDIKVFWHSKQTRFSTYAKEEEKYRNES
ncbi:MAG: DnaB-like helicase C-terminal domain-containing protein [Thermodesulfobacteriota bacterium]